LDQKHGEEEKGNSERFDQLVQVMLTQPVPSEKLAKEASIKAG
jgi:hypothetical protein